MEREIISMLLTTTQMNSSTSSSSDDDDESKITNSTNDFYNLEKIEDETAVMFFPLMQYLTTGQKRNKVDLYLRIVASWTNIEFKEHFRLSRQTAYQLIGELDRSKFIPCHRFGTKPVTAELSFLIFLWFLANTEPLRTIADSFYVSISSTFRIIRRVLQWILTKRNDIIKWPQDHAGITKICNNFFSMRGLPNILGAIDCTHIRILKPTVNSIDYCNRKKYFSIILQAVVDSEMRFTNVCCGEPGSLHDARVLRRSSLYNMAFEFKEAVFPNNTRLLGDSAYPLLPWLLPPFRDNGRLTVQQNEFNFVHSSSRMVVEKAFGILKGRFRLLKIFSEYQTVDFIAEIVVAACILHNYCIDDIEINDDDLVFANIPQGNIVNE